MALIALVVLVLIAKEILVFNAESLVLISFSLFIGVVVSSVRTSVVEGLNARAEGIKKEFYSQRDLRKKTYQAYLTYLRTQKEIANQFSLYLNLYNAVKESLVLTADRRLKLRVYTQVSEKLKAIARLEARAFTDMQAEIAISLPEKVRKDVSDPAVKDKVLQSSIVALASNKSKK